VLGQGFLGAAAIVNAGTFLAGGEAQVTAPVAVPAPGVAPTPAVAIAITGMPVPVEGDGVDVEGAVVIRPTFADQRIDWRTFEAGAARLLWNFYSLGRGGRSIANIEQRVGIERLANEGLDLEVGQRQQLDRLLKLRRHNQRLSLP
jgi:hypothetical protein